MINIQIRGNLIDIEITSISRYNFDNFSQGKYSASHIKDFISNSSSCKTIYKSTLPIIEQNSELQVTSFENDHYYDDGYTFLRANINEISTITTVLLFFGIQLSITVPIFTLSVNKISCVQKFDRWTWF